MKDPIKIIHKFKNNNNRIQYKVYIFIGSLLNDSIYNILDSIKNKDFFSTLKFLSKKQYKELEDYYGSKWYDYFFIKKHIDNQKNLIIKNTNKKKLLIDKYGKNWYSNNIEIIYQKKIEYSFASNYYTYLFNKNKIKSKIRKKDMDFRTYFDNQTGGNDTEEIEELEEIDKKIDQEDDDNDEQITEEQLDEEVEDNFDLDELTNLYSLENVEDNKEIIETSKLISKAVNDKSWEKKEKKSQVNYDKSLDTLTYDTSLEEVYDKTYIKNQYIFKDDTVKIMRQKITVSIPFNEKYGDIKFVPEYQYFWSEYFTKKSSDKIMIGQKWIRRNELLSIDIQPNENLKVYENLRNNLKYLKDSFGFKIKREDDETSILRNYDDYITNNEIYMLDIINDLGLNYSVGDVEKRNLYDVYVNIYFPLITYDRNEYGNINNDMKMESTIYNTVEQAKLDLKSYNKYFNENHIIQSIIHVNIADPKNITGTVSPEKYNLYRIFENFIVNDNYPFVQYQTPDSLLTYKIYTKSEKLENPELMSKWFENAPYGISFKSKVEENKFVSINLHENGRMDYKITWKEDDKATVDDITKSYKFVRDLLTKINNENKKVKFILPTNDKFKYAFINTIQKFTIPEKFKINHNDLSEFSRFFYPYVALQIEPKKRESKKIMKSNNVSKFGTYLRYKRINKYENRTRMHLRILYFLRNFELNTKDLIDEVAKQFNITSEEAAKELDFVKDKYSKAIKKSKKVLKKLRSLPKSKPPGIDINIQGRDRDRYKIRIAGARSKDQLDEINSFMKVLIFLYSETYLYKKSKYQKLKDLLKNLTNIAKRRNKVSEFVNYESSIKNVKAITALDKKRLAFKPEKGQSQWTRSCQNSVKDKKRRPVILPGDQLEKLIKLGYKFNKESGFYEKIVTLDMKGKKNKVTLRAIKQFTVGDSTKFNFYTCDPETNGQHTFIGFLSRGNNPDDLPLPCCFKKDQLTSNNKKKVALYKKAIGIQNNDEKIEKNSIKELGDKLYILQDTNKVQEGRFIHLNKDLDIFFNKLWKNDYVIKSHYLIKSNSGYFFKFTVKDNNYNFLAAISNIYNKTIEEIKIILIDTLEKDKDDKIYTYLNNGDIKEAFGDKENYIDYIKTSKYLEYDIIGELSSIPGVLSDKQIFYFILEKRTSVIKRKLDVNKIKDNYYLKCLNIENNYQINQDNDFVILLNEGRYYFPIFKVKKSDQDKKIILSKKFNNNQNEITDNIISELKKYYSHSCINSIISEINNTKNLENKMLIQILQSNNIKIKNQIIDSRNKCKYLLIDKLLFPVIPSGITYKLSFMKKKDFDSKNLLDLENSIKQISKINKIINLDYIPKLVHYESKKDKKLKVISIQLKNGLSIPVKVKYYTPSQIKKLGLSYEFKSFEEIVNDKIINNIKSDNKRIKRINDHNYYTESYNLYKLELSVFLNNNISLKNQIINIVRNDIPYKKKELRKILFSLIDTKLSSKIKNKMKNKSFSKIVKEIKLENNYTVKNVRDVCKINKNKNKCDSNPHCIWTNNECKFILTETMAIDFVNKVIEEMIQDNINFKEIIQEDNYFVSDIVDYSDFSNRTNQKIIKTSNFNIKKIMSELFGQDNVPILGRRKMKNFEINFDENYKELVELGNQFKQNIINNKDSVIRAYVNCYYWINNPLYDISSRNLGYNSELQTQITYILKAKIIDFILNNKNDSKFKLLNEKFKDKKNFFKTNINKFRKNSNNTDGIVELYILSIIFNYPIVVFDNYNNVKYIFMNGIVTINSKNIKKYTSSEYLKKSVYLKFNFESKKLIPVNISSIYYA